MRFLSFGTGLKCVCVCVGGGVWGVGSAVGKEK